MLVHELDRLSPAELGRAMGAEVVCAGAGSRAAGISHDSRTVAPGELFFAIRGDRFDGHAFVTAALKQGACGVVVSSADDLVKYTDRMVFRTDDTTRAFGALAAYLRRHRRGVTVIGITGSNGKTTTKELIHAALAPEGQVSRSPGNFNNHIGVPVSIFSWPADLRYGIVEMGTESPGEIARLGAIVRPDIALITNVGDTHLRYLGSRDGVAREKGFIYEALAEGGVGVINRDSPYADDFIRRTPGRTVTFGMHEAADINGRVIASDAAGSVVRVNDAFDVHLGLPGIHNASNLLAALAAAQAAGFEPAGLADRFREVILPGMRMERLERDGITFYNDAYNANPQSMRAALGFLRALPAAPGVCKIFVCGDMLDLGAESAERHRELGREITSATAQVLVAVGTQAALAAEACRANTDCPSVITVCADAAEAQKAVFGRAAAGDVVYIKGSRGMHLERLLEHT